ncbi:MAG: hypothetical protein ACK53L_23665, partial [Pirellulaceae bacterium]
EKIKASRVASSSDERGSAISSAYRSCLSACRPPVLPWLKALISLETSGPCFPTVVSNVTGQASRKAIYVLTNAPTRCRP